MRLKSLTLDDLEGHRQPVWLAILATAGLFVATFWTSQTCSERTTSK